MEMGNGEGGIGLEPVVPYCVRVLVRREKEVARLMMGFV